MNKVKEAQDKNKMLADKEKAMDYIQNKIFCRLEVSKEINQVGVFAYKDIPPGVDPLEPYDKYGYILITDEEATTIDSVIIKEFQRHFFSPRGITLAQLDDRSYFSQYMNHSDTPNTIFDSSCKSGVRTTARIKAGEEVTANYKETEEILKREIEDYHYYNQQTQEK